MKQYFRSANDSLTYFTDKFSAQLTQHQQLLTIVRSLLPENLAEHVQYCMIKQQTLIIFSKNASWGSQLRFHTQLIIEALRERKKFDSVDGIQVRLLLPQAFNAKQRAAVIPSSTTIQSIALFRQKSRNDALTKALQSLSTTLAKKSPQ